MINNVKTIELLKLITDTYEDRKVELSKYDSFIGDGDHGFSLARGCKVAYSSILALPTSSDIHEIFKVYGRTLTAEIGGAMGPLFGLLFTEIGKASMGSEYFGLEQLANGLQAACNEIMDLGGARVGDKTMVDSLVPTVYVLSNSKGAGEKFKLALDKALIAADDGVKSTIPLQAKRGRSKYLHEKSIGHQDAGATSFYYFIKAIREYVYLEE